MSLNCVSVLPLLQHTLPGLKKHRGSVTLVSTVAVGQGFTRHVAVSAAKGAVEGMTRALAAEVSPHPQTGHEDPPELTFSPRSPRPHSPACP